MQLQRIKTRIQIYICVMLFSIVLASCTQSPLSTPTTTKASLSSPHVQPSPTVAVTPTSRPPATPTPKIAPMRYTSHVVLQGVGRPDDLAFDPQGRLLFSDEFNSTISRVNADGTVNLLLKDANGPEGLVVLPNGTIIFAEQETNRIVSLAPGSQTPIVLHTLPGIPSSANCKHGVDGIALDLTTNTLIVPDSPIGVVYRMSLDGKTLTTLASGIARPVGVGVDRQGNIFIADECGNAIWRITPSGNVTRIGGFGMPDDVLPDGYGNVLVIDLQPAIHALIRLNLTTV